MLYFRDVYLSFFGLKYGNTFEKNKQMQIWVKILTNNVFENTKTNFLCVGLGGVIDFGGFF